MSAHQSTILWKGLQNNSLEFCSISYNTNVIKVESTVISSFETGFCSPQYLLIINKDWSIQSFEIDCRFAGDKNNWVVKGIRNDHWIINNKPIPAFNECIDIDISLTPFTNTLPINRLHLLNGRAAIINVLYIDIEKRTITAKEQRYTKLENNKYKFETLPKDFEAVINVNSAGIVTNYPGLFTMVSYAG
jgi:uncharacterized protein